jgi:hypothetical protein
MFPVYGRKCFDNWVADVSLMSKRLKRRCRNAWDNTQKDFHAAGFDAPVKRQNKHISVGGRYIEK